MIRYQYHLLGVPKVIKIHPRGSINVCSKFECNPSHSYWDILTWTSDRPISSYWAMLPEWLQMRLDWVQRINAIKCKCLPWVFEWSCEQKQRSLSRGDLLSGINREYQVFWNFMLHGKPSNIRRSGKTLPGIQINNEVTKVWQHQSSPAISLIRGCRHLFS